MDKLEEDWNGLQWRFWKLMSLTVFQSSFVVCNRAWYWFDAWETNVWTEAVVLSITSFKVPMPRFHSAQRNVISIANKITKLDSRDIAAFPWGEGEYSHIGMGRPKGYGFCTVLVWNTGIDFAHLGPESGEVFEGVTVVYEHICRLVPKKKEINP